jgi:hypothetical protein
MFDKCDCCGKRAIKFYEVYTHRGKKYLCWTCHHYFEKHCKLPPLKK